MAMTSSNSGFAPWPDRLRRSAIILIATALGLAASVVFGGLTLPQAGRLADEIRRTLTDALAAGGSTLRDFMHADGAPGYFQQSYFVYGREGEPCRICATPIRNRRMGNRSTFFCPACQR